MIKVFKIQSYMFNKGSSQSHLGSKSHGSDDKSCDHLHLECFSAIRQLLVQMIAERLSEGLALMILNALWMEEEGIRILRVEG